MNEQDSILRPDELTSRDLAIVEAGRLIDALTIGNGDLVKDVWYQLNKFTRLAVVEIRQTEAKATGQLAHTSINEYLGI